MVDADSSHQGLHPTAGRSALPVVGVADVLTHGGLRSGHLPPVTSLGTLILFEARHMAIGWAGDNAVNEQIDATVKDGIRRVQSCLL